MIILLSRKKQPSDAQHNIWQLHLKVHDDQYYYIHFMCQDSHILHNVIHPADFYGKQAKKV
jgi:hypothetical protein